MVPDLHRGTAYLSDIELHLCALTKTQNVLNIARTQGPHYMK